MMLVSLLVMILFQASAYSMSNSRLHHIARIKSTSSSSSGINILTTSSSCETKCISNGTVTLISSTTGSPTADEISDQNIVQIVSRLEDVSDSECNRLVWKCLGYDLISDSGVWSADRVFPKWAAKYPSPPDLVGITRDFSPEVDKQVRQASMDLMRSIPRDFKGGVRSLEGTGFKGFKLSELTPTKTRRAQLVNWLIYYRERLHGKTIEQLREERAREQGASPDVAALPSERQFQSKRLDT
jgi:hypothetical protein